jgi:hypothetical protein
MPCLAWALLGDAAVSGRLGTGLAYARIEAEVADQVAGGREAADLADRPEQRRGGDEVHPGQGEQPPHLDRGEHLPGQRPLDQGDLAVEEGDLAQAGRERLLLVGRQLLRGEPAAAASAEEIAHRRPALQVADQRRVHLVLRPRAQPHQLHPRRDPPPQDTGLLIRQPHRRQKAAGE